MNLPTDKEGKTALMLAANRGDVKLMRRCLEQGYNIYQKDKDGNSVMTYAIEMNKKVSQDEVLSDYEQQKRKEVFEILYDYWQSNEEYSKIHIAAYMNDTEKLRSLFSSDEAVDINVQVNVNARIEKNGNTALHIAIEENHKEVFGYLIKRKYRSLDFTIDGNCVLPPLQLAIYFNRIEMVKALLKIEVDVNSKDRFGDTPLHHGIKNASLEIVKSLVLHGAKLDVLSCDGHSPLHLAIIYRLDSITEFLLESGASSKFKDRLGNTPFQIASKIKGNERITKLLAHSK